MTSQELFLTNFKRAAHPISPAAHSNGIRLDPAYLEVLLRRSTSWLTPRAVKGFDSKDFSELNEDARSALKAAVEQFSSIAKRAPRDGPAPTELVDEALPVFLKILEVLEPILDEYAAYHMLKHTELSDFVTDFAIRAGLDSTGDPGVWVWVIIKDEAADLKFREQVAETRRQVDAAIHEADIGRWPYIRFRTESEQHELEAEELTRVR
jgi:hypothetical protein